MRATVACPGASAGVTAKSAVGVSAGRSSEAEVAALAGSLAPASTKQQRRGVAGGRGSFAQCAAQQTMARSSVMAARGAATAMRVVIPTATSRTQVVSRFRDTVSHCMSEHGE